MAKKKEHDKLSSEVAMALAAGMSYGKWKAMQTPVKIEPKKNPIGIETQRCAWCGAEFTSYDNRNRKYCGDRCRMLRDKAYSRQKYIEKVEREMQNEIESGTR